MQAYKSSTILPEQKNILLTVVYFSFFLAITASALYCAIVIINPSARPSLITLLVLLGCILYFYSLYRLALKEKLASIAIQLVLFYFLVAFGCLAIWGITLGQALLLLALAITLSGATLGNRFTQWLTVSAGLGIVLIQIADTKGWIMPNLSWRSTPITFHTSLTYALTFVIFAGTAQLFNHSIESALERAITSEKALKKERDSLEETVAERTRALQIAQFERVLANQRFADFGRHAAGFLHDLVNPLSAQLLHMEKLYKGIENRELTDLKDTVDRAFAATKRMENFIRNARKELRQESIIVEFDPQEEIESAIEILGHSARAAEITFVSKVVSGISIAGNPTRFYKLVLNLITNAIDSFDTITDGRSRVVQIKGSYRKNKPGFCFSVKDNGCGIEESQLNKIFEPFYTTKKLDKGSGIGMSICQEIAEKDFGGTISVLSSPNKGTEIKVWLPNNGVIIPE